jgi:hypothetical protein
MSIVQITATILAAFVQAGMKEGLLRGVPDLCAVDQAAGLSCPTTRAIFNSSIVWYVLRNINPFLRVGLIVVLQGSHWRSTNLWRWLSLLCPLVGSAGWCCTTHDFLDCRSML